jgi:hypothetical protein
VQASPGTSEVPAITNPLILKKFLLDVFIFFAGFYGLFFLYNSKKWN